MSSLYWDVTVLIDGYQHFDINSLPQNVDDYQSVLHYIPEK
jgi:hypothetical protein